MFSEEFFLSILLNHSLPGYKKIVGEDDFVFQVRYMGSLMTLKQGTSKSQTESRPARKSAGQSAGKPEGKSGSKPEGKSQRGFDALSKLVVVSALTASTLAVNLTLNAS